MQTIAVSSAGFFGLDRQHIRHLVQSSGGTYSGDLLADYTTHLVYKDLELAKRGEKYATALSWEIPVLPFSWLQSCAQRQSLLADIHMPSIAAPAVASPATKLQQLCLQDNKPSAQRLPEGQADTQERASPCTRAHQQPPDIVSQIKRQHTTLEAGQCDQQSDSAEDFELISCIGSCQPDLSDALLTQSPSVSVADACSSQTCSDHCTPDKMFHKLQDLHVLPLPAAVPAAAAAAAAAPGRSSRSSSDEIIIPDSQPDDATAQGVNQQLASTMTPVTEAPTPRTSFSPSTDAPGTGLDNALTVIDHLWSRAEQHVSHSPECTSADVLQHAGNTCRVPDSLPEQRPSVIHADDHASMDNQHIEAVADTEMQALPSSSAASQGAGPASWPDRSPADSSHAPVSCSADAASDVHQQHAQQGLQHAKQKAHQQHQQQQQEASAEQWQEQQGILPQQQQHQQQQQHNLLQKGSDMMHQPQQPARSSLADSASQRCPGNSDASHAFVIEDSDEEGDFQPLKPARPSTGSFHDRSTTSKLACYRSVPYVREGHIILSVRMPVRVQSDCPFNT